eukprot:916632_1
MLRCQYLWSIQCKLSCGVHVFSSCYLANIYSPSNGNSVVKCSSTRSCLAATIRGPSNGSLIVNCTTIDGFQPCASATIYGPTNGSLSVICRHFGGGNYVCDMADIYCPIYGGCELECVGGFEYDCRDLLLDARSMISGSLSFHSVSGF